MENYLLNVKFDDGKSVIYDVKEDLDLPGYSVLREVEGLFQQVQLDESRTCVFWNEDVDLPSDILYEYGMEKWDFRTKKISERYLLNPWKKAVKENIVGLYNRDQRSRNIKIFFW